MQKLPEEIVRQRLLALMIEKLGYPKSLIAVEKELFLLPYLKEKKLPLRRADILVFGKNIHPVHSLYPLLMIECKKAKLTESALEQAVGYNYYVQAYFVAVAGKHEVKLVFSDGSRKLDFLPAYQELLQAACLFSGTKDICKN